MTDKQMIVILGFLIIILSLFLFLLMLRDKRNKDSNLARKRLKRIRGKNTKNHLYFLYRIYMATPLLRRYFVKTKNVYRSVFPMDEISLNKKTTKKISECLLISLGLFFVILLLGKNNVPYLLVALASCYLIFTNLINQSEQKLQLTLLDQLNVLITDQASHYEDSHMVDESLEETLDDLPYEISLHADIISGILKSPNVDLAVDEYIDVAPNRFLLLYATVCATILEHGDKLLKNGRSLFITNLEYIKEEIGTESLKIRKRKVAFNGKTFAVLLALLMLMPIEMWAEKNMPEIVTFYRGSIGVLMLVTIVTITLICYELINILKDDNKESFESPFIMHLSKIPVLSKYITAWINHNYTKALRMQDKLKSIGSKESVLVFITRKLLIMLSVFILSIGVFNFAIHKEREEVLYNFKEAYSDSIVPNEEYRTIMQETSLDFKKVIKDSSTIVTDSDVNIDLPMTYKSLLIDEINKRADKYKRLHFKAYMFILSIIFSVISFFAPDMLLNIKAKIRKMAREDEVAQFRTIIIILMHEDGMTLDKVLEWLERFAHAFKPSITECLLNLKRNEKAALNTLRENESGFAPFRQLCDSLLNVDKVGLEASFSSLEVDRSFYAAKRKDDNDAVISSCNQKANTLIFVPIVATLLLYLIVPTVLYALSLWNELNLSI